MKLRHNLAVIACLLLFSACVGDNEMDSIDKNTIMANPLSLELEFGAENVPDEYLLAGPGFMCVNDEGDVFVTDENRIKVFDKDGKEKMIIGRPGRGPGEFDLNLRELGYLVPSISHSGELAVEFGKAINVYSPEYEFIKTIRYREDERFKRLIEKEVVSTSVFRDVYFFDNKRAVYIFHYAIIYEDPDTIFTIAHTPFKIIKYGDGGGGYPYPTTVCGDILSNNKIIYAYKNYGKDIHANNATYILNVFDIDTFTNKQITLSYDPVPVDPEMKNRRLESLNNSDASKEDIDHAESVKFYPAISNLHTDGNIVFIRTFSKSAKDEYLFDVIDVEKEERLSYVYFPIPFQDIEGGYGYRQNIYEVEAIKFDAARQDMFPTIQKYKIDPAVYGK
ncbi:hypothetical protein ACFL5P_01510 [candidate division KSB1 bacterium]